MGSFFPHEKLEQTRTIAVPVRRLDDILQFVEGFKPTFLRTGGELLVLAGARDLTRTYWPLLLIEFHTFLIGMKGLESALEEFESFGYKEGLLIGPLWDAPWIRPLPNPYRAPVLIPRATVGSGR